MIAFIFAILVGIVDTGIASDHIHFANTAIYGEVGDTCGHGTAMAGIVVDEAPKAELLSVDVASTCYSSSSLIAEGIKEAADAGADVMVVAWNVSPQTPVIALAAAYAQDKGATVVFSDGLTYESRDAPYYLGGYKLYGGTSVAAAILAGEIAWLLSSVPTYLPNIAG